jgi:phosphoribosylaminoimidazolecarboxamide formyltransferase/IMP cyclohydrolase
VKTLHPKVHGGLLLDRNDEAHAAWMNENGVKPIDIVVSNLYPFEEVVAGGADLETAAENIDIGGPSMVRSAAKAALLYDSILIVTEPAQYQEIIRTLNDNNGDIATEMRRRYALKAFRRTKEYDSAIVSYLEEK